MRKDVVRENKTISLLDTGCLSHHVFNEGPIREYILKVISILQHPSQ